MCILFLTVINTYLIFQWIQLLQIHPEMHEGQFLNVLDDLCRFILHEVVNVKGKFFNKTHDLATNDKYLSLGEWHKFGHG